MLLPFGSGENRGGQSSWVLTPWKCVISSRILHGLVSLTFFSPPINSPSVHYWTFCEMHQNKSSWVLLGLIRKPGLHPWRHTSTSPSLQKSCCKTHRLTICQNQADFGKSYSMSFYLSSTALLRWVSAPYPHFTDECVRLTQRWNKT